MIEKAPSRPARGLRGLSNHWEAGRKKARQSKSICQCRPFSLFFKSGETGACVVVLTTWRHFKSVRGIKGCREHDEKGIFSVARSLWRSIPLLPRHGITAKKVYEFPREFITH